MDGPLANLRVLDCANIVAMPTALHILADMGAEVIKVESHTLPRNAMGVQPDYEPGPDPWNRESTFNVLNRSKLGVTLNLKSQEGLDAFRELVRVSDVLVENNRTGTMDRLGLGWGDLRRVNPGLVYLSNTGFGHTGPWKMYAGVGSMFELTCGLSQFTGYADEGPRRVGSAWFDPHVGWTAVYAILTALRYRQRTGLGQHVDFSMYQVGVATMGDAVLDYYVNGRNGKTMGSRHSAFAPYGVYPCAGDDRWVAIAVRTDGEWDTLQKVMRGHTWATDPRFASMTSRKANEDALDEHLRAWTRPQAAPELARRLQAAGVSASNVNNARDVLLDPQTKARGFYERVDHPEDPAFGTRLYHGRPFKLSANSAHIRRPAPKLGEHNEWVIGDLLGRSEKDVAKLYELDVIGKSPPQPTGASGGAPRRRTAEWQKELDEGSLAGVDADYKQRLGIG